MSRWRKGHTLFLCALPQKGTRDANKTETNAIHRWAKNDIYDFHVLRLILAYAATRFPSPVVPRILCRRTPMSSIWPTSVQRAFHTAANHRWMVVGDRQNIWVYHVWDETVCRWGQPRLPIAGLAVYQNQIIVLYSYRAFQSHDRYPLPEQIEIFSHSGQSLKRWHASFDPVTLAVDERGLVYLANSSGIIYVYTLDGQVQSTLTLPESLSAPFIRKIVVENNRLFVAAGVTIAVYYIASDYSVSRYHLINSWSLPLEPRDAWVPPFLFTVDCVNNWILVTSRNKRTIFVLDFECRDVSRSNMKPTDPTILSLDYACRASGESRLLFIDEQYQLCYMDY